MGILRKAFYIRMQKFYNTSWEYFCTVNIKDLQHIYFMFFASSTLCTLLKVLKTKVDICKLKFWGPQVEHNCPVNMKYQALQWLLDFIGCNGVVQLILIESKIFFCCFKQYIFLGEFITMPYFFFGRKIVPGCQ